MSALKYAAGGASITNESGVWTMRCGRIERSYTGPTAVLQAVFAAKRAQRGQVLPVQQGTVAVSRTRRVG